jgi:hypothetical protein
MMMNKQEQTRMMTAVMSGASDDSDGSGDDESSDGQEIDNIESSGDEFG